ncbi:MAG: TolC family protein, partial [Nannocystaceae bacterium]|nr:TolC family protein [Nannocystaceae bacterium]
ASMPPREPSEVGVGGSWKPAGLPGPSAFHTPAAERDDPYGPRPAGVASLSLDQVTRYALDNPVIKSAQEKVVAMQALLSKAKFAWIPVVETTTTLSPGANVRCDDLQLDDGTPEGFEFQFCRSGVDPDLDISTLRGYFGQLSRAGVRFTFRANTVLPLVSFGRKLKHAKKLGKAAVAIAKLKKLAAEQETVLLVRQAHVTLLLARESQSILREAKKVLDKAYNQIIDDVGDPDDWAADPDEDDGTRDPDDVIKVELAAVELEVKMRAALKVEALALSALWALGGSAAPKGFNVSARGLRRYEITGGMLPVTDYIDVAHSARPEAKLAQAAVQAREAQERLARAAFLPDMGLALSFGVAVANAADRGMSQLYYQDGFNYSRFTAALAMRWRWDTGAIFDLRRARAEVRSQEYQRQAAKLLLARDVHQAYQDLVESAANMDAAERAATLAWRLVLSQQLKEAAGGGEASELLRNLEKWYTKRFERASAIHAHTEAVARLSRAVGTEILSSPVVAAPPVALSPAAARSAALSGVSRGTQPR